MESNMFPIGVIFQLNHSNHINNNKLNYRIICITDQNCEENNFYATGLRTNNGEYSQEEAGMKTFPEKQKYEVI